MTLTAGFRCTDGFVVAADTEITLGSISFQGQKLAIYNVGSPDTLCVALSGNVAYGLTASQGIRDAVLRLETRSLDAIKLAVSEVVERVYEEQIFKLWESTGRDDDDDFALIVGVEDHDRRFTVLGTHLNSVHEVPHYEFSGAGNQLAHYVAERLCSSAPTSTAVTEHLVSQIFREIKGKGFAVGGNTEILSRRAHSGAARFFPLKMSGDDYRFLWGLDDALLSAVRVALDSKGHGPLEGHTLPKGLEDRLATIRNRLARLYAESSAESQDANDEHHRTEFGTEYGNILKDL